MKGKAVLPSGVYNMAIKTNTKYRFKRSMAQEPQMQYLIQELRLFNSYSQILMVSAIIGFRHNAFVPIQNVGSDTVQMTTFEDKDRDFIDFIAFAHKKEQAVLNSDEKYAIFESYANGGFPLLVDKLGVDFVEKEKNDRLALMKKYLMTLLTNGF